MKNSTKVASTGAIGVSTPGRERGRWGDLVHCAQGSLVFLMAALALSGTVRAEVNPGDILLLDAIGGSHRSGALFRVDPATGERIVLSDFGNAAQGSLGNADLTGVAVGRGGQIFVSALSSLSGMGAIFAVDPHSGARSIVSDFSRGDIQGSLYFGLAVDANGNLMANLQGPRRFGVVRVDPRTDSRTIVCDFSSAASGGFAVSATGLSVARSGKILVASNGFVDGVVQIDPHTAERRVLSDFADRAQGADMTGVNLTFSTSLASARSEQIFLSASGGKNLLLRIDPTSGEREVLSDFDNPAQGPVGRDIEGVAVQASGEILVGARSDPFVRAFSLYRVDPLTGQRSVLSDSMRPAQGPSFTTAVSIAVVSGDNDAGQSE